MTEKMHVGQLCNLKGPHLMNAFVGPAAGGGTGVVCGPIPGLSRTLTTTFAADGLGFGRHPKWAVGAPAAAAPSPGCCSGSVCSGGPLPGPPCTSAAGYEAGGTLFQVMSDPSAPVAAEDGAVIVQGRLVRTEGAYGIGAGFSTMTGDPVGFLAWLGTEGVGPPPAPGVGAVGGPPLPTVVLQSPLADGQVAQLLYPRALAVRATLPALQVTVAGSGVIADAVTGVVLQAGVPMLALVPVCGCALGTPVVLAGNGDPTLATQAYYDLAANPCDGGASWYVCGTGQPFGDEGTPAVAFVALVNGSTGQALQTAFLDLDGATFPDAVAVSLVVGSGLVTAAVNVPTPPETTLSPALLWSLAPGTLASLAPWPTPGLTQYNDLATLRVAPPVQVSLLTAVRVRLDAAGRLFLVGRGVVAAPAAPGTGLGLPAECLVVVFFAADTSPDGTLGALAWGVPDGGLTTVTQPTDVALLPDATLVIVGNAFQSGGPGSGAVLYDTTLPFLNVPEVVLGQGAPGGPWCLAVPTRCPRLCPVPGGNTGQVQPAVILLFQALAGCADVRLANALSVVNPRCVQVYGDVDTHITSPAQPGAVLDVVLSLGCNPVVQNAGPVCCTGKPWGSACPTDGGPLRVDYCCNGPSTLAVAGPLVLGFLDGPPEPVVPGTVWYNGTLGRMQAYDNTGTVRTIDWT